MKILFVITGLGVGGAERQVVDVADALAESGHKICICYVTGPALFRPKSQNIELIALKIRKSPAGFVNAYLGLRVAIRSYKPDVVHSHMFHANLLARLVRLSIRIPRLISTAHSTNEGGALRMSAYRLTAHLSDVTTNVSKEAVAAFEAKGAVVLGTMLAISNGIDTARFRPSPTFRQTVRAKYGIDKNTRIIIAVGSLNKAKDYFNLLHSYSILLQNASNTQLWIIGDGDLKVTLLKESERLKLGGRIKFLGVQSNVEEWLNGADIFVLSSAWEGFGLVVAEAMACEKVVVATDAGGVSEVLGDCGFLVEPRKPVALAEALNRALKLDSDEAKSLGMRARIRVLELYSLNKTVKRWLEIYDTDS